MIELDFVAWADKQALLLEQRRWDDLDLINLIEEVRGLGNAERKELKSRLRILLGHLLKWQYQPQTEVTVGCPLSESREKSSKNY